jgi:hypothetical protein
MKRLFNLIGMTIGGWIGWEIGAMLSLFTAFIVSVVGTGIGLYAAQKVVRRLLP